MTAPPSALLASETPDHGVIDDQALYALLNQHGIDYTLSHHQAVFTVEDSQLIRAQLPAGQGIKNLFLKDRKQHFWLISVIEDHRVDLKALSKVLQAKGGLSFASPEALWEYLKVTPGSVTPYAILNTTPPALASDESPAPVGFYVDERLYQSAMFQAHPLRNDRTITANTQHVLRWLESQGYSVGRLDFTTATPHIIT